MMPRQEKCDECIRVHLSEKFKKDLKALAAIEGCDKLSTFIRNVLHKFLYGHSSAVRDLLAATVRDE